MLASIVPVLTLALVIRAYFAGLLLDDIRGEASRTAAVAERVIEESDAMLRRGAQGLTPYDDDVMVWISQLIDQDVNIFYGPELVATSERDLFASGLPADEDLGRRLSRHRPRAAARTTSAKTRSAAFPTCWRRPRSGAAVAMPS